MVLREEILDAVFPKFCVNCDREGFYLCPDCFSLIEILDRQYCPFCQKPNIVFNGKTCKKCKKNNYLDGLYSASDYNNFIIKKLINSFKYQPFVKDLSETLSSLIIAHLIRLGKTDFSGYRLIPVPLHKRKLKWRGYNQSEEIAKALSRELKIPFFSDALIKIKNTTPQAELKKEQRQKNLKNAFLIKDKELIFGKKILLVDDVFTTGATLNETARLLKEAGCKEVFGMTVARD